MRRYRPRVLAVLGVAPTAPPSAGATPARPTSQDVGDTPVWVLPNPSGLNAHYHANDLARLFRELRVAIEGEAREK